MRILSPDVDRPDAEWFDQNYSEGHHRAVAVFDFDGVIASPTEDFVYKLHERDGERDELTAVARAYGLIPEIYDTPYLRHLVFQAILAEQDIPPEGGPLLALAKELSQAGRAFFILSARSGVAAIGRAQQFMMREIINPQETFFVGRVAKGRQLDLVRREIDGAAKVVYFEDSQRHSRNSHAQRGKNISTVFVEWKNDFDKAEKMLERALGWFHADRSKKKAA